MEQVVVSVRNVLYNLSHKSSINTWRKTTQDKKDSKNRQTKIVLIESSSQSCLIDGEPNLNSEYKNWDEA